MQRDRIFRYLWSLKKNVADNVVNVVMNRKICIIALTEAGKCLAEKLQKNIPEAALWFKPRPFSAKVQQAFQAGNALIMICATGIAVRSLAPVIDNKYQDPPVLVLDEQGRFVLPLLSGHEGGANDWAHTIAHRLNAQLVMTTAQPYLEPVYTVGMGCERGCSAEALKELLISALAQAQLTLTQIHSVNSIDLKADETGLIALAESIQKPFQTFARESLAKVEHRLSVRSTYVFNTVGVYGVAESAALWAAQTVTAQPGELVLKKIKHTKATCAVARSYPQSD